MRLKLKLVNITWKLFDRKVKLSNEGKAILSCVKGREKRALKHAILRNA